MGACLGRGPEPPGVGEESSGQPEAGATDQATSASRRTSAFSSSPNTAASRQQAQQQQTTTVQTTKNRRLKHDKIKWRSDIPLTEGQLKSKRDEFWDTAPAFEGKTEIWAALKAAVQAASTQENEDFALAQAILDGAGVSLPHGSLVECYDELGTRYAIPVYCLSYPINIVVDSDRDSPAEFSEPIVNGSGSKAGSAKQQQLESQLLQPAPTGQDLKVKVRVGLTGSDIRLVVNTGKILLCNCKRDMSLR